MNKKQKKKRNRILVALGIFVIMEVLEIAGVFDSLPYGLWVEFVAFLIPYLIAGYDVLAKAWHGITHRQPFDENLLMAIATIGAFALVFFPESEPHMAEGAAVILFYQVGSLFESYAVGKTRKSISDMMDIAPDYANVLNESGEIEQVDPFEVAVGSEVVVKAGERIQDAIEKAPLKPVRPFKIFIRKGLYQQKVIIDRPNIVLVGEDRDSTCIVLAETEDTRIVKEYHGQPVHHGVVVLQEGADDCVISGLTIYNNYGTVVEPGNTKHQMAVYGRGTRTIVINSNIWADGNDDLSLWAREGGMYYHADLYLRCPGVDFLCPRGWCYATRCRLYGDGRALIWHDGRGNKDQKLVITNSQFDAKRPTPLGRYHHDSQFYIVNCKLSENILDQNIEHAYKGRTAEEMAKEGKKLDPCPWGQRTYYYGNRREGGHSGWLNDNLKTAPGSPEFHMITALWTFDGKWDPEQHIRELWNVLAY